MRASRFQLAGLSALFLLGLVLWDASGMDLPLAFVAGDAQGFPLRDNWWLVQVMHDGVKTLAWLFLMFLCIAVVWPVWPLSELPFARRVQLVATALLAWGTVATMKASSATSCPWDLQLFGGVARYVSHWGGWRTTDGGGGRCFPASHATAGFAFVGGFFALRHQLPRLARAWLWAALATGLVLGLGQQLRGAHFMSHTLWTGWLCWMVAWLTDPVFAGGDVELLPGGTQ
jgi:membrane-associated PAP2 superfamily phosphatase